MTFRRRDEEGLDDEIRDYLDRETRENIEAGMASEEARHAALRKLGRPVLNVKEDTRAVWGWVWLEHLWQDLRHAKRMLLKNPGFTFVAVASLAIGIGANSAIFSLADALLLRPLPVLRPSDVVTVGSTSSVASMSNVLASYRDYLDFRDRATTFAGMVAYSDVTLGFSTQPDVLPRISLGMLVTGNFFQVLGVEPVLGRAFRREEDQAPGRDAVVVLSHDFWEREFASDHSVLGRTVRLDGIEFTVIGVAPERFTGMDQFVHPAFYMPIMMWPRLTSNPQDRPLEARDYRGLAVKGRLQPGVTVARAQAEMATIGKSLERAYPDTNRNQRVVVLTELAARIQESPPDSALVAMLSALALAVLVVACANVAGLLTSRAPARAREISLRLAIGAGRPRLIRQLLTESLLMAVAGGAAGLAVGYAGVIFFRQIKIPGDLPIHLTLQMDRRALLFSLAVSIASAVLFGLAPAIQTTRLDLIDALRSATSDIRRRRFWGRNLLVAAQVAISLVLLTVATFMYRGFSDDLRSNPGFRRDHLLMMTFDPSLVHYTEAQSQRFFRDVVERARSVPGVKSATIAASVPMSNQQDSAEIVPEGYQLPQGQDSIGLFANTVGENYFDTAGIRILRGRGFRVTDTATSPNVAVVNEELAKRYWPGQDPIGKRFRLDNRNGPFFEIVGVAKTIKYLWVAEAPTEFVYFPLTQHPKSRMLLLTESFGDPRDLVAPLREVVRSLDANQPIYNISAYEDYYRVRAVSTANLIIETVASMGLMGVILAMVGLYGLVAYAAGRRTREIGIRMAIGAQRSSVLRMIMRQGLTLALIGLAFGVVASFGAERLLNAMFSGSGVDFATYLLVTPALLTITMLAAFIPARRASRVDPMKALRYE
jgi:predicted permease